MTTLGPRGSSFCPHGRLEQLGDNALDRRHDGKGGVSAGQTVSPNRVLVPHRFFFIGFPLEAVDSRGPIGDTQSYYERFLWVIERCRILDRFCQPDDRGGYSAQSGTDRQFVFDLRGYRVAWA